MPIDVCEVFELYFVNYSYPYLSSISHFLVTLGAYFPFKGSIELLIFDVFASSLLLSMVIFWPGTDSSEHRFALDHVSRFQRLCYEITLSCFMLLQADQHHRAQVTATIRGLACLCWMID